MTAKEIFGSLIVAIVGGVVVFWLTTGYQNDQQRKEQQREQQLQQEEARRKEAEVARQRERDEQRADADRKRREEEERRKQPRMSPPEQDINRDGSDYKDFVATNLDECLATCARETQCRAITYTKSSRQCWMKGAVPLRQDDGRYISAVKVGAH